MHLMADFCRYRHFSHTHKNLSHSTPMCTDSIRPHTHGQSNIRADTVLCCVRRCAARTHSSHTNTHTHTRVTIFVSVLRTIRVFHAMFVRSFLLLVAVRPSRSHRTVSSLSRGLASNGNATAAKRLWFFSVYFALRISCDCRRLSRTHALATQCETVRTRTHSRRTLHTVKWLINLFNFFGLTTTTTTPPPTTTMNTTHDCDECRYRRACNCPCVW